MFLLFVSGCVIFTLLLIMLCVPVMLAIVGACFINLLLLSFAT